MIVAGIDIGKSENYVSINQKVKKFKIEDTEEMKIYMKEKGVQAIILEPTGVYSIPIIEELYNFFTVYIVPTYLIAKFKGNKTQKNDTLDAKTLEKYFLSTEKQFHKYRVDEKYIKAKKLNIMISELESLKKAKTREINRLRGDMYAIDKNTHNYPSGKLINMTLKSKDRVISLRAERIMNLKESISIMEERIKKYVQETNFIKKQVEIIMTVPMFSYFDACIITSKIVDVNKFDNVNSFKKFLGFGVNREESGSSIHRTKKIISHKVIKSKFYLLLMRNLKNNGDRNIKSAIYYYKSKYNNHYKAMMKVASRLVTRIYFLLKTERPYDTEVPFIDKKTLSLLRNMIQIENEKLTEFLFLRGRL